MDRGKKNSRHILIGTSFTKILTKINLKNFFFADAFRCLTLLRLICGTRVSLEEQIHRRHMKVDLLFQTICICVTLRYYGHEFGFSSKDSRCEPSLI